LILLSVECYKDGFRHASRKVNFFLSLLWRTSEEAQEPLYKFGLISY